MRNTAKLYDVYGQPTEYGQLCREYGQIYDEYGQLDGIRPNLTAYTANSRNTAKDRNIRIRQQPGASVGLSGLCQSGCPRFGRQFEQALQGCAGVGFAHERGADQERLDARRA